MLFGERKQSGQGFHLNRQTAAVATTMLVLVAGAGIWWTIPWLQGDQRAVEREAGQQIERARRLLHRYNATLSYDAALVDELGVEGIEVDPDDLSEDVEDEYQRIHDHFWTAYQPVNWDRGGSTARANYGNLPRQIRDGVRGTADAVKANRRLLDEAMVQVDRALAVSAGSASSRSNAEANRLRAVILYQQGTAAWIEAMLRRSEAKRYRAELAVLAGRAAREKASVDLVADTGIEDEIKKLESGADDAEDRAEELGRRLDTVGRKIADLESRLTEAEARRDDARKGIARLRKKASVGSNPDDAARWRGQIEALNIAFRDADREAHALAFGTLPLAELELGGDYLTGRLVEPGSKDEPTVEFGLSYYRSLRDDLTQRLALADKNLQALRDGVARLTDMRSSFEATQEQSSRNIDAAGKAASDVYGDLSDVEAEAFDIEEKALGFLDRAAQTAKRASDNARQWVSAARQQLQSLSPEAKERSAFNTRAGAGWLGGYVAALEADARLAKARIYQARFEAYTRTAEVLEKASAQFRFADADIGAERAKVQHAHDVGVAEITEAMQVLQRAHRDAGKHWALIAQAAAATDLLSLFGDESYKADAAEAYRSAVTGREDQAPAAVFVTRLKQLENP